MNWQKDEQTETKRKPNRRHNNNDNNDNNIRGCGKSKFNPPDLKEVEKYFIENGYTKEVAIRAFNYYDIADWKDSQGKKVRNWKQKMQGTWFKDENKMKSETLKTLPYAIK